MDVVRWQPVTIPFLRLRACVTYASSAWETGLLSIRLSEFHTKTQRMRYWLARKTCASFSWREGRPKAMRFCKSSLRCVGVAFCLYSAIPQFCRPLLKRSGLSGEMVHCTLSTARGKEQPGASVSLKILKTFAKIWLLSFRFLQRIAAIELIKLKLIME